MSNSEFPQPSELGPLSLRRGHRPSQAGKYYAYKPPDRLATPGFNRCDMMFGQRLDPAIALAFGPAGFCRRLNHPSKIIL